jgi:transcriptional regulator GlxA family with amidase domain
MKAMQLDSVLDWKDLSEIVGVGVPTQHDKIDKSLDFMAKNFSAPIQVKDLANASGMSTHGLAYAFDKHLGISPGVVLRPVRLNAQTGC